MKKIIFALMLVISMASDCFSQSLKIPQLQELTGTNVDSAWFVISIPGGGSRKVRGFLIKTGVDSITTHAGDFTDTTKFWRKGNIVHFDVKFRTNGILLGGVVTRLDSSTYRVSATKYVLNSIVYDAPQADHTLPPNTDTLGRKDVFYVNSLGVSGFKLGDYATNPQPPYLIPSQELPLSIVDFPPGNDTGRLSMYNIIYTANNIDSSAIHSITLIDPYTMVFCKPSGACDTLRGTIDSALLVTLTRLTDSLNSIRSLITSGGQNFANADLVATGNRNHDMNDKFLNISNFRGATWLTKSGTNGSYTFFDQDTTYVDVQAYNGVANTTSRLLVNGTGSRITNTNNTSNVKHGFWAEGDSATMVREDATLRYEWINSADGVKFQRRTIPGVVQRKFVMPTWGTGTDTAATKAEVRAAMDGGGTGLRYATSINTFTHNNRFFRKYAGPLRATCTGANQPITWAFLDTTTQHKFSSCMIDSVKGSGNDIQMYYSNVKNVITMQITVDETLATGSILTGGSVGTSQAAFRAFNLRTNAGRLTGNGTSWTNSGLSLTGLSYNSTSGLTVFSPTTGHGTIYAGSPEIEGAQITYVGERNRRIRRAYSSLSGQTIGFFIIDSTNAIVTGTLDSDDKIAVMVPRVTTVALPAQTANSTGYPCDLYTASANYWIDGTMELYMVGYAKDSTTIVLEWQTAKQGSGNYATNYRITRATEADPNTETTIFNGMGFTVTDTGLTPMTKYIYRYYPTILGVESLYGREKVKTVKPLE